MQRLVEIKELDLAPKSKIGGSYLKTLLFSLIVAFSMFAETWATIQVGSYIAGVLCATHMDLVRFLILCYQLISYLISPSMCKKEGWVPKNSSYENAEGKWKQAKPILSINTNFYPASEVLWWGPLGMFIFAPAIWKMQWAGKTVFGKDLVKMLEFKAFNRIPTPKFPLPILGDAFLGRDIDYEGKTSMAFCYKYLPIVDHIRQLDESTIIGKMTIGTLTIIYFTLKVPIKAN